MKAKDALDAAIGKIFAYGPSRKEKTKTAKIHRKKSRKKAGPRKAKTV